MPELARMPGSRLHLEGERSEFEYLDKLAHLVLFLRFRQCFIKIDTIHESGERTEAKLSRSLYQASDSAAHERINSHLRLAQTLVQWTRRRLLQS